VVRQADDREERQARDDHQQVRDEDYAHRTQPTRRSGG
jgi:hypothetical protein